MTDRDVARKRPGLLERLRQLFRSRQKPQVYLRHGQEPETNAKLTCERIAWSGTRTNPTTRRPRF